MASVPLSLGSPQALLSVTDKSGLEVLAKGLAKAGYNLIASGGTADFLSKQGLAVTRISELTGYPEIFGGRVKTLHPVIHGGILGPQVEDFGDLHELGIAPIAVVVVNLYNFAAAVQGGSEFAEVIEKIDIGGPTLIRAAAKNHSRVSVLSDPGQYEDFLSELATNQGTTTLEFRKKLAGAAFAYTAHYERAIDEWFNKEDLAPKSLRYGENPHQAATMAIELTGGDLSSLGVQQAGGKALSYNNLVDMVAGLKLVADFQEPCCAALKHTNPCGFGLGPGVVGLERALRCDPVSAFGGIFVFHDELDMASAEILASRFLELVIAPSYAPGAKERLLRKKNLRVLTADLNKFNTLTQGKTRSWGALCLSQVEDAGFPELDSWRVVAGGEIDSATTRTLTMLWKVCKHGKSNAIVLGNEEGTLGLGFGQMSRIDSAQLAIMKAAQQGLDLAGCCAASDGFFPFPDGIEQLASAGVRAIIAPGGSIRDQEVAAAAGALGVTLVLTDRRHFNH